MDNLKTWLSSENRSYTEGVGLYQQYGKNKTLLRSFLFKETPDTFEKLVYELSKIASVETPIVHRKEPLITFQNGAKIALTPIEPIRRGSNIDNGTSFPFPQELEDMIVLRGHLTNKKAMIHNAILNRLGENDIGIRKEKMAEMAAIRAQIEEINDAEAHFKIHHSLPVREALEDKISDLDAPIPTDPVALFKLQKSLRERRSKANARLKPIPEKHPDRLPLESKINKIDVKLQEIDKAHNS